MERTTIGYEKLKNYLADMLEKGLGYDRQTAETGAYVLAEADARGHASHGAARVKLYHDTIQDGDADVNGRPEIVHETPVSLVIDGHCGSGFAASKLAMDRTIEKARASGTCMTAVRNSGHFGMAGVWAEMAADQGMMGIALTNTVRAGIPSTAREALGQPHLRCHPRESPTT